MDLGAKGWGLLVAGAAIGVCLVLVSGRVRDEVLDAVDAVDRWWWGLIDAGRRLVLWVGTLVLVCLAMWGAVALVLLPRLAEK